MQCPQCQHGSVCRPAATMASSSLYATAGRREQSRAELSAVMALRRAVVHDLPTGPR